MLQFILFLLLLVSSEVSSWLRWVSFFHAENFPQMPVDPWLSMYMLEKVSKMLIGSFYKLNGV